MGRNPKELEQQYANWRDGPHEASPLGMAQSLAELHIAARDKHNGNQIEATKQMQEWLRYDRRFDSYDHKRLIERVNEVRSNGVHWSLDDPYLKKGGQRRPGGMLMSGSKPIRGG